LTNKEVVALNQDELGVEALKYRSSDSLLIWFKPLKNDGWAACFVNRSLKPKQLVFDWQSEMVNDTLSKRQLNAKSTIYKLRDLWLKKDMGDTKQPLKATIPPHDVLVMRLTK
jgi:alpha-galactosidase